MYNLEINQTDFNNHTKYIRGFNISNGDPYDNLITRYSFDDAQNHHDDIIYRDEKPNYHYRNDGKCYSFPDEDNYPYNYSHYEEKMSTLTPNLAQSLVSNKIRLETSSLQGVLQVDRSVTKHSHDFASVDSNKLGVYFSPTKMIDLDIVAHYADMNFDNFFGDPQDRFRSGYSGSIQANKDY